MTSYRFKILIPFFILLFAVNAFCQVGNTAAQSMEPLRMLGMQSDSLFKAKQGGIPTELMYPGGQKLAAIDYNEDWFGLNKVRARYFIGMKRIIQISLALPKNIKRNNIVKSISNYLGKPCGINIAKKDSLPKYSAQWITGAVSYGFNDYGDSSVVLITKSLLYNYNVYYLPAGSYIIQKISVDVNGDNKKDEISLVGHRADESSFYYDKLFFIAKDGKTEKERVENFPKNFNYGYSPTITVENFTNKKTPEIFVTAPTGGSGGIVNYTVFSFRKDKAETIFTPDSTHLLSINGSFEDDYKVLLTVEQTNKSFSIGAEAVKDKLNEMKVYDESGKLIKKTAEMWINSYGLMEVKDVDKDGLKELIGTQAIKGIANYITIAQANSVWKYKNSKFELRSANITAAEN